MWQAFSWISKLQRFISLLNQYLEWWFDFVCMLKSSLLAFTRIQYDYIIRIGCQEKELYVTWKTENCTSTTTLLYAQIPIPISYSTSPRNGNPVNGNHLEICLLSSQKNRNSLTWVLVALTVCFTYPVLYRVSAESRAGEWELWVIDNEKSWSLRADARRRIILYYQTQVSLQETGSEPLGLGPSFSVETVENGNSLACLPG